MVPVRIDPQQAGCERLIHGPYQCSLDEKTATARPLSVPTWLNGRTVFAGEANL